MPIKAVKFGYRPTRETKELLETFRMMVNHAIHICLEENIKGRLKLGTEFTASSSIGMGSSPVIRTRSQRSLGR